jgi:hypothetical protein
MIISTENLYSSASSSTSNWTQSTLQDIFQVCEKYEDDKEVIQSQEGITNNLSWSLTDDYPKSPSRGCKLNCKKPNCIGVALKHIPESKKCPDRPGLAR